MPQLPMCTVVLLRHSLDESLQTALPFVDGGRGGGG